MKKYTEGDVMKIYKTQEQVKKDIKNGVLQIQCDVKFDCDIFVDCDITARNITARNIVAWNIDAWNIKASNIHADDIIADKIDADHIFYFSVCCARESFVCKSIYGKRENSRHFCLDGEIVYKRKEQ